MPNLASGVAGVTGSKTDQASDAQVTLVNTRFGIYDVVVRDGM